jgi:putative NIF3 family GTP cyclohydrolase 1 type 2
MEIREIEQFWKNHNLPRYSDEGFRFGPVNIDMTGVLVCWKPTVEAMAAAHEAGCNLIITHEELNFPPVYGGAHMDEQLTGGVTLYRIRCLVEWNLTVFRGHTSLDRFCILDELVKTLGLSNPTMHGDYWERTYDIAPVSVRDLARRVRTCLGMGPVRVAGDLNRIVRRVALPWGGVAISANPNCVQTLLRYDPDVLITGETEEIPMLAALDAGVCLIETGHSESESPGMRRFAATLAEEFPGLRVEFYQNPRPWSVLETAAGV